MKTQKQLFILILESLLCGSFTSIAIIESDLLYAIIAIISAFLMSIDWKSIENQLKDKK